ncbi:MAG: hypothetical protein HC780_25980 [Leptolyngbyaceae cyanobacterium CSU_1_3]|nr:hypothetical protein [Leptolyngbyaceae cyanobacterium CSU_1_3]
MINRVIKPNLNIEVSEIHNKFPTTLWFEVEGLTDDLDENEESPKKK